MSLFESGSPPSLKPDEPSSVILLLLFYNWGGIILPLDDCLADVGGFI